MNITLDEPQSLNPMPPQKIASLYRHGTMFDETSRDIIAFLYHVSAADKPSILRATKAANIDGKLNFLLKIGAAKRYIVEDDKRHAAYILSPELRNAMSKRLKKGIYTEPDESILKRLAEAAFISILDNPYSSLYLNTEEISYAAVPLKNVTLLVCGFLKNEEEKDARKISLLMRATGGRSERIIVAVCENGEHMESLARKLSKGTGKELRNVMFTSLSMVRLSRNKIPLFSVSTDDESARLTLAKI